LRVKAPFWDRPCRRGSGFFYPRAAGGQRLAGVCQPSARGRHLELSDYIPVVVLIGLVRPSPRPDADSSRADSGRYNFFVIRRKLYRKGFLDIYNHSTPTKSYTSGSVPKGFLPWYCIIGSLCRSNSVSGNVCCKFSDPNIYNNSCLRTSGTPNS
jgi:hypothetical protein